MPKTLNTRRAAHRAAEASARGLTRRVLAFIRSRGAIGTTDHELAEALDLLPDTARSRRVALRDAGLVRDSGRRRLSPSGCPATVWTATGQGPSPRFARRARIVRTAGGARAIQHPTPRGATAGPIDDRTRCYWCGSTDFWNSGVKLTCRSCHPPAVPGLEIQPPVKPR